jgi:hypothetical protein
MEFMQDVARSHADKAAGGGLLQQEGWYRSPWAMIFRDASEGCNMSSWNALTVCWSDHIACL